VESKAIIRTLIIGYLLTNSIHVFSQGNDSIKKYWDTMNIDESTAQFEYFANKGILGVINRRIEKRFTHQLLDNEREINAANIANETARINVLSDSLRLVMLQKLRCEATNDSSRHMFDLKIKSAQLQIEKSIRSETEANAKSLMISKILKTQKNRNDSIFDAIIKSEKQFISDTLLLRHQKDSIIAIMEERVTIAEDQLKKLNAKQTMKVILTIMLFTLALSGLVTFIVKTKKIFKDAKVRYRSEEHNILKDALIRYWYYSRIIRFSQNLVLASVALTTIYAIALFIMLIQTSDMGASFTALFKEGSFTTLGVLSAPLVFSITYYNHIETKMQELARIIIDFPPKQPISG
jgi:hypothetical protein